MSIENVSTDTLIREMESLAVGIVDPVYKLALNEFIRRFKIAKAAIEQIADPKPLTLDELRQFEGMPVYLVCESIDVYEWQILDFCGNERTGFRGGLRFLNEVYGMTWEAYRHKPKEEEKDG